MPGNERNKRSTIVLPQPPRSRFTGASPALVSDEERGLALFARNWAWDQLSCGIRYVWQLWPLQLCLTCCQEHIWYMRWCSTPSPAGKPAGKALPKTMIGFSVYFKTTCIKLHHYRGNMRLILIIWFFKRIFLHCMWHTVPVTAQLCHQSIWHSSEA